MLVVFTEEALGNAEMTPHEPASYPTRSLRGVQLPAVRGRLRAMPHSSAREKEKIYTLHAKLYLES